MQFGLLQILFMLQLWFIVFSSGNVLVSVVFIELKRSEARATKYNQATSKAVKTVFCLPHKSSSVRNKNGAPAS